MAKIVLTIKQMERLHELGLKASDSFFVWNGYWWCDEKRIWGGHDLISRNNKSDVIRTNWKTKRSIPTYTLQEVINKLPFAIYDNKNNEYRLEVDCVFNSVSYKEYGGSMEYVVFNDKKNLLDNAYEMLLWTLEHLEKRGDKWHDKQDRWIY